MRRACLAIGLGLLSLNTMASAPAATQLLPATVNKPPMVTREQWGSKPAPIPESRCQVPQWITIHHAGELWKRTSDARKFVRNMQIMGHNRPKQEKPPKNTFWPDVPYHYLIAPDGRIFEGRPVQYEPESNTKYPLKGNIGIEMMGDFNVQRPSIEQLRSCVHLTAWLCRQHHIGVERVRTHKDAAKGQTDCPGKDFYRYIENGQFRRWVTRTTAGQPVTIAEGPMLKGGPMRSIKNPE